MSDVLSSIDEIIGTNISDAGKEPREIKWTDNNGKEHVFSVEDVANVPYADAEFITFIGMSAYRQAIQVMGEPEFIEGETDEQKAERLGAANFFAFRKTAPHRINKTLKVNGEVIPLDKAQKLPTGLQLALLGVSPGGEDEASPNE